MCEQCAQRPRFKEPSGKIHPFCGQSCAEAAAYGEPDHGKEPKSDGRQQHNDDGYKARHGDSPRKKDTYKTGSSKPVRSSRGQS